MIPRRERPTLPPDGYRARTARARRVEVELGDDAPDDVPDDVPDDTAGDASSVAAALRTSHRRRWWWVAVPVVTIVALVVGQVVTDRRERALLATLAQVPGVVAPLDGPAQIAWVVGPGTRLATSARVGSVLVAAHVSEDHAVALEGLDVATGSRRWAFEVVAARAGWSPAARADDSPCAALPDRPGQVACLVRDGGGDVVDRRWATLPATTVRLLVLDAADGTVHVDREVPRTTQSFTSVGPDVLLVGAIGGDLDVRSQTLLDGTEHWRTTADAGTVESLYLETVTATLLDRRTLAVVYGPMVTLVSTDGAVLRTVGPESVDLMTGQSVESVTVPSTTLGAVMTGHRAGTTIVWPSGGETSVDGSPLPITADDGSVPGLVLTRTPRLQAWDTDGAPRWEARVVDAQDATILRGRVHVGTSSAVVTFDGATGAELWRVARPSVTGHPVTDGRHLYVQASRGGRHSRPYDLVALHVADGSEAWRVAMPADVQLTSVSGLLVASEVDTGTGDDVVRVLR